MPDAFKPQSTGDRFRGRIRYLPFQHPRYSSSGAANYSHHENTSPDVDPQFRDKLIISVRLRIIMITECISDLYLWMIGEF